MKIDDVKSEDIKAVVDAILENCDISDLDMYNDLFEDRKSIFEYILENYIHKKEGHCCCCDKARYVARDMVKQLTSTEFFILKKYIVNVYLNHLK